MRVLLSTIWVAGRCPAAGGADVQLKEVRRVMPPDFRDWIDSLGIPVTPSGPELHKATAARTPTTPATLIVAATTVQIAARSVADAMGIPSHVATLSGQCQCGHGFFYPQLLANRDVSQPELLEVRTHSGKRLNEGLPFLVRERREDVAIAGVHAWQQRVHNGPTSVSEIDQQLAAISRVRDATDQAAPLERVQERGHRPCGNQQPVRDNVRGERLACAFNRGENLRSRGRQVHNSVPATVHLSQEQARRPREIHAGLRRGPAGMGELRLEVGRRTERIGVAAHPAGPCRRLSLAARQSTSRGWPGRPLGLRAGSARRQTSP